MNYVNPVTTKGSCPTIWSAGTLIHIKIKKICITRRALLNLPRWPPIYWKASVRKEGGFKR